VDAGICSSRIYLHPTAHKNPRYDPNLDRLGYLSTPHSRCVFRLSLFFFLLVMSIDLIAQVPHAGGRTLLHGTIFTAQGRRAAEAIVEIRDLHGIKVASSVTDGDGNFEISGAAEPGEYIFLVASASQTKNEQVLLAQADLELSLALPPAPSSANPTPGRYTVSAKRLGIPAKARKHLAAANEAFGDSMFDKARREIEGALEADATFPQAFTMRAFIKLAEKDPRSAAEDARHAASLDGDDAEAFIALAMSYNSLREFPKSEEAAQQALSLRPESWQARLELAKSFYGQREFVLALRELDSGNINFPDAHLVRANVLMNLGRIPEASEEFRTFVREAPADPRAEQISRMVAALR
jgi:Tfp pilus assembly protein PilF